MCCSQNVTYALNTSNDFLVQQICASPLSRYTLWDNGTGSPLTATPPEPIMGSWSYQCNWQPTDNPNHLNYPSGLFCAPYQNPDIGGIRNFDNILFAWIQVFQHMVMQDWSVGGLVR